MTLMCIDRVKIKLLIISLFDVLLIVIDICYISMQIHTLEVGTTHS